jgi:hypothetical protein
MMDPNDIPFDLPRRADHFRQIKDRAKIGVIWVGSVLLAVAFCFVGYGLAQIGAL